MTVSLGRKYFITLDSYKLWQGTEMNELNGIVKDFSLLRIHLVICISCPTQRPSYLQGNQYLNKTKNNTLPFFFFFACGEVISYFFKILYTIQYFILLNGIFGLHLPCLPIHFDDSFFPFSFIFFFFFFICFLSLQIFRRFVRWIFFRTFAFTFLFLFINASFSFIFSADFRQILFLYFLLFSWLSFYCDCLLFLYYTYIYHSVRGLIIHDCRGVKETCQQKRIWFGWFGWFNGISIIEGYLTQNPFSYIRTILFQTI